MSPLEQLHLEAEENPYDPRVWCRLALAFEEAGQIERAREALKRARAIPPSKPEEWVEVAAACERLGDHQQAAAAYRRAVQLDRRCVTAYLALGALLMRVGDTRAAALTLRVAVSHSPDSAELALMNARALALTDHHAEAQAETERAARLAPQIVAREGSAVELAALRSTSRFREENEKLRAMLEMLLEEGRKEESTELFMRAMENASLDFEAHLELSQMALEVGLVTMAVRSAKEAIRIRPNTPEGHMRLGLASEAAGNIYDAVVSYRTAVLISPSLARGHYQLGLALRKTGDLREAANALVKASANAPDDEEIKRALEAVMAEKSAHKRAPLPRGVSEGSVGSFGGDLSVFALPEMLEFLSNRRTSGTLQIISSYGEGVIELHRGNIVRVSSPHRKPLIRLLQEQDSGAGLDLKQALEGFGEKDDDTVAGEKLIAGNVLPRAMVHEAMTRQVRESLEELVGWKEGEVTFHALPSKEMPVRTEPDFFVDTKWALFEVMAALHEREAAADEDPTQDR